MRDVGLPQDDLALDAGPRPDLESVSVLEIANFSGKAAILRDSYQAFGVSADESGCVGDVSSLSHRSEGEMRREEGWAWTRRQSVRPYPSAPRPPDLNNPSPRRQRRSHKMKQRGMM